MAKSRTKGLSPSPTRSSNARFVAADWTPWLSALAMAIIFAAILPQHDWIISVKDRSEKTGGKESSRDFVRALSAWANPAARISHEDIELDLSAPDGTMRTAWVQPTEDSLRLRPTGLVPLLLRHLDADNPWSVLPRNARARGLTFDNKRLNDLVASSFANLNHEPINAKFVVENGRVMEFQPERTGSYLDARQTIRRYQYARFTLTTSTPVVLATARPQVRLAQTNDLGIVDLLATGESDFGGSSASRIHNIRTGTARFTGLLLAPGEEFSFVEHLGPVTAAAGFKPELVIKTNATVAELGGGLCQVSTTTFRAALNAGLPITARRNHSYAVKYYAPQGTDATIYPGAQDLKFVNDTSRHILIWTRMEGSKLYFDFYGQPDGRTVILDGPHQYDRKPDGSLKARLARTVTLADKTTVQEFHSRYVSQDLFPRVYEFPQPIPPAPNPDISAPAQAPLDTDPATTTTTNPPDLGQSP